MQALLRKILPAEKNPQNKAAPPVVEKTITTIIPAPTILVAEGNSQDNEVSISSDQQSSQSSSSTGTEYSRNKDTSLNLTTTGFAGEEQEDDTAIDSSGDQEQIPGTPITVAPTQTLDSTLPRHQTERNITESPVRTHAKRGGPLLYDDETERAAVREGKEDAEPTVQSQPVSLLAIYFEKEEKPELIQSEEQPIFIQSSDQKTLIYTQATPPENIAEVINTYQRAITTYPDIKEIRRVYIPLAIPHQRQNGEPNLFLLFSNETLFANADIEISDEPQPRKAPEDDSAEKKAENKPPYQDHFLKALKILNPAIEKISYSTKNFPDAPAENKERQTHKYYIQRNGKQPAAETSYHAVYFVGEEQPEFIQSLDGSTLIFTKDIHPKNIADAIKIYLRAIETYPKIRKISQIYIPLAIPHERAKKPNLHLTISNGTFFANADIEFSEDPQPREASDAEIFEDDAPPITKDRPHEKQFLEALRILNPDIVINYSSEGSFFAPDTPFTPSPNAPRAFVDSDEEVASTPRALKVNDNRIIKCEIQRDGTLPGLLDDIKIKEFNQTKLNEAHEAYAKKKVERLRALGRQNPYQESIRREFTKLNFIVDLDKYLQKNKPNPVVRFFGFLFQTTSYKNYTNASNYLDELSQEWLEKKIASEKQISRIETLEPTYALYSSAGIETYVRTNLNPDQKQQYYSIFSNLRVPEEVRGNREKADRFVTYAHNLGIARVKGHR
ncbi:MAG TPA: hypothetical protein VGV92_06890 [Gammaproteobacteria bacterium]|nr:hypothetical protein [Gammaproteobacteria bacterium]